MLSKERENAGPSPTPVYGSAANVLERANELLMAQYDFISRIRADIYEQRVMLQSTQKRKNQINCKIRNLIECQKSSISDATTQQQKEDIKHWLTLEQVEKLKTEREEARIIQTIKRQETQLFEACQQLKASFQIREEVNTVVMMENKWDIYTGSIEVIFADVPCDNCTGSPPHQCQSTGEYKGHNKRLSTDTKSHCSSADSKPSGGTVNFQKKTFSVGAKSSLTVSHGPKTCTTTPDQSTQQEVTPLEVEARKSMRTKVDMVKEIFSEETLHKGLGYYMRATNAINKSGAMPIIKETGHVVAEVTKIPAKIPIVRRVAKPLHSSARIVEQGSFVIENSENIDEYISLHAKMFRETVDAYGYSYTITQTVLNTTNLITDDYIIPAVIPHYDFWFK